MIIHRFAVLSVFLFLSGSLSVLQAVTAPKAPAATSISVTYAGVYSPAYTYAKGNVVKYGNCTYLALGAVATNASPSASPSLWTVFGVLPENNTFGTGSNSFSLDFVTIGNPGNTNDTTGYGGVSYVYEIGTYDVSQNQVNLAISNGVQGLQGASGQTWIGDQPATGLSWYQCAAFVNWLNTSQGYSPAYNLTYSSNTGYSMTLWTTNQAWTNGGINLYRNANCVYFLPSENEWYKAAYYDPNKIGASHPGYWLYPTGSTNTPIATSTGTNTGTAVYNQQIPASVYQSGGLSPYGTMGQGGNVWQWIESAYDGVNNSVTKARVVRGSCFQDYSALQQSSNRYPFYYSVLPTNEVYSTGFRVGRILP